MPAATPAEGAANPAKGGAPKAKVSYSVYTESVPVGSTVRDARAKIAGISGMPADTVAYVNNVKASDETVIGEGAAVSFIKRSGEKG